MIFLGNTKNCISQEQISDQKTEILSLWNFPKRQSACLPVIVPMKHSVPKQGYSLCPQAALSDLTFE